GYVGRVAVDERVAEEALRHREVVAQGGKRQVVGDVERQEVETVSELVEAIDAEVWPTEVLRLRPLVGDKFILSRRQVHVGKGTGVLEPVVRMCFSGAIIVCNICAATTTCWWGSQYTYALAE